MERNAERRHQRAAKEQTGPNTNNIHENLNDATSAETAPIKIQTGFRTRTKRPQLWQNAGTGGNATPKGTKNATTKNRLPTTALIHANRVSNKCSWTSGANCLHRDDTKNKLTGGYRKRLSGSGAESQNVILFQAFRSLSAWLRRPGCRVVLLAR